MADTTIDFAAIQAEVNNADVETLKKMVLDAMVKQKVATKKYYNAETAKAWRQKRAEELKQAKAKLAELGLLENLNTEASRLADQQLAEAEATAQA